MRLPHTHKIHPVKPLRKQEKRPHATMSGSVWHIKQKGCGWLKQEKTAFSGFTMASSSTKTRNFYT
jgi:hypothetical protein